MEMNEISSSSGVRGERRYMVSFWRSNWAGQTGWNGEPNKRRGVIQCALSL